ncbi:MAG: nucleotidyl transferase AbiEii/AbiGii toxin family protein [Hyphomicrobium sp.]
MAFSENYRRQVALLLRTVPFVAKEKCFGLKGGTAINLFVRDLPRLSVDIDLTYLNVFSRDKSLGAIDKAMLRIAGRIEKGIKGARITEGRTENTVTKLVVREGGVQIKIEVTPVMRGCAYDAELRGVSPAVEAMFGFAEMQVVSFPDLYAGKLVAALDRQHPRDLFDVRDLLRNEGIGDDLRAAFITYLLSHNRPMAEVLAARPKDISAEFLANFQGMTSESVTLEELVAARGQLVEAIVGGMPDPHRKFLVSFEAGAPDWSLLPIPKAEKLPAVKWRQHNLDKLTKNKRVDLVAQLETVLGKQVTPAQLTLEPEPSGPAKQEVRGSKPMTPAEFVERLTRLATENGTPFARLRLLAEAEQDFAVAMGQYKGYAALTNASKCFFLETVERFNVEIHPRVTAPVSSHHALFVEKLVTCFQSLRAAELAALNGYPLQGYTILRNVSDICVHAAAALQGLTDFERLEGIFPGMAPDASQAKKNRKNEEHTIRRQMDGKDSGLTPATLDLLKELDDLYDAETHGARVSLSQSLGWLKGTEPLRVTPSFSETRVSLFINRYLETAWMLHRLLPSVQLTGLTFAPDWAAKWATIDESFEVAVMSVTKQLGKQIGAAVCEFVKAKFPFDSSRQFQA